MMLLASFESWDFGPKIGLDGLHGLDQVWTPLPPDGVLWQRLTVAHGSVLLGVAQCFGVPVVVDSSIASLPIRTGGNHKTSTDIPT